MNCFMSIRYVVSLCAVVAMLTAGAACKRNPEPTETMRVEKVKNETEKNQPHKTQSADASSQNQPEEHKEESPMKPLVRQPTSADPHKGQFTIKDATEGLPAKGTLVATIETSMGNIKCTLDEKHAPVTVANFVGLARGTRSWWDARRSEWVKVPYYDGSSFHRIIPDFMIQGGDYLGDGTGGVGYEIKDEIHGKHDKAGLLCMANRGPNTNGGQFFITDASAPHLDGGYTIFGVCEPVSLINQIARVPQQGAPYNRPNVPVTIKTVSVTRE